MRRLVLALASLLSIAALEGCYVHTYSHPPPPEPVPTGYCDRRVWMDGYYDRWGYWHRPHWRCVS